jgi:multidrug efflux pump subunit AcrA (membrane-fusion protein)
MTASVVLGGGADANLVLLPLGALAGNEASPAVWVLDTKSQRVHLRPVKVAQLREDGVAIASGLAAGEVVVTAGVHKLREDQLVRRAAPL